MDIVNKSGREFFEHWRKLPRREGLVAPHVEDYLDHAPPAFMPGAFIQELVGNDLIVRFMGTELVSRWQRDDTGKVFGAHLDDASRERTKFVARAVMQHPCGMLQHGVMVTTAGREAIFEAILLPLSVNTQRPPRMVIYSSLLDMLGREEHGQRFCAAGELTWIDIGAGTPSFSPLAH